METRKKSVKQLENEICKYFNVDSVKELTKGNWEYISRYFNLSEKFIEKYQDKVDWYNISTFQKLTERLIKKYKNKVNWYSISKYQKLSEKFIEKYKNKVKWVYISIYQKLSESFIEKFKNRVYWIYIVEHQKLSEEFIKKHSLKINKSNWLYKDKEFKKEQIVNSRLYECYDDYFIAYKNIRNDNYSHYNFQYKYEVGGVYESHADHTSEKNSFGLSAWTYKKAKEYYNGKIIKLKIYYKDVARIVYDGGKIRCTRFEVLEEVE